LLFYWSSKSHYKDTTQKLICIRIFISTANAATAVHTSASTHKANSRGGTSKADIKKPSVAGSKRGMGEYVLVGFPAIFAYAFCHTEYY